MLFRSLSIARQLNPTYPQYVWYPEVLHNASHSAEWLGFKLFEKALPEAKMSDKDLEHFVREDLVKSGLGILDATNDEIAAVLEYRLVASTIFADMISRRAQIGWSTHGHSAVDVNIYGSNGAESLRGNHENTEIGHFLHSYLDVDVDAITKELQDKANGKAMGAAMMKGPSKEELLRAEHHYDAATAHQHGY